MWFFLLVRTERVRVLLYASRRRKARRGTERSRLFAMEETETDRSYRSYQKLLSIKTMKAGVMGVTRNSSQSKL